MKIAFNDKFLDSLIQLPRGIQEKVSDFIRKFRENSKSTAIHLEPISDFKDKNFRTARIDQKYRAVLHVSQADELYTLMWVDNHDEAMAWAKNKVFQWNGHTQSYQLFELPPVTTAVLEDPIAMEVKDDGPIAKLTREQLLAIGTPEALLSKVERLRSIRDLELLEGKLPAEVFERLFYLLDGIPIEEVLEEVEMGKIKEATGEAALNSPNNLRFLADISDDTLRDFLSGELQKWMLFLHPSQRALVNGNYKGAIKVSGAAGTGKTVAAMHRAKYLSENELGRSGKPILFTTYTKSLTRNLEKTLRDLHVDRNIVQLDNLDGFVVSKAKSLELLPKDARFLDFPNSKTSVALWEEVLGLNLSQFDSTFLDEEYRKVILQQHIQSDQDYFHAPRTGRSARVSRKDKMEIYRLVQAFESMKKEQGYLYLEEIQNRLADYFDHHERPFGHVVADEIQDFSQTELRLLRSLVDEGPNDLFLVGDPLQSIYDRKPNFSKAGISIRGNRSRRLKVNYRTTEEIKRVAYATISSATFDDFDGGEESKKGYISLFHGPPPVYEVFAEKGQEVAAIVARILALTSPAEGGNFRLGDICVATRTRDGIKEVRTALHQGKIAYLDMSSESSKLEAGDAVRLSTFHSLKGLEFKVVILADVNKRNFPFRPGDYEGWDAVTKREHDRRELSLMYVAMSRAIHTLVITGTGGKSGVLGV